MARLLRRAAIAALLAFMVALLLRLRRRLTTLTIAWAPTDADVAVKANGPAHLGVERGQRSSTSVGRSSGKRFHYFASHRKRHSRLGKQPEQLILGIRDVLEGRGLKGFFDLDDLKQITRQALVRHVLESCCVVVLLNDEACRSEWVALELRTAADARGW